MQIREITEKDNKAMELIVKESLEAYGLNISGTAYFDPQLGALSQFYETQLEAKYWVAVDEQDEILGGGGIGPFGQQEGVCELQKLYVKPEAQGQGLATELMKTALGFAKDHYTYCYIETFKELETANLLYAKFGFQELKEGLEGSEHSACDTWYLKRF